MDNIQARYEVGAKTIADDCGFEMEFFQRKVYAFKFANSLRKEYPNEDEVQVYVFDRLAHKDINPLRIIHNS